MEKSLLTANAISPLDGRYWKNTQNLSDYFSEFALFRQRLHIELKYLAFLSNTTNVLRKFSVQDEELITKIVQDFNLEDYKKIKVYEETTKHDVKSLEYFLRDKLGGTSLSGVTEFIHLGLTSEDVNNLAYSLLLRKFLAGIYEPGLEKVINCLELLATEYRDLVMLGRTHGQAAVPTTLGKEMAVFLYRLKLMQKKIKSLKLTAKLNGAVGNYNALTIALPKVDWLEKSKAYVENLGLVWNPLTTQVEGNDNLVELFNLVTHVNNILLSLSQDMWRYISDGLLKLKIGKDEVGSSTMPQKVNPIDFENAEGNIGLANALFIFFSNKLPVSRLQRDLSDSTVKRNIGVAFGHTILAFNSLLFGLGKIIPDEEKIKADLEADWSVLSEAVQTILRVKGVNRSYELVKDFSRGIIMNKKDYQKMISKLPVDSATKKQLLKLTPQNYIGFSKELVDLAIGEKVIV